MQKKIRKILTIFSFSVIFALILNMIPQAFADENTGEVIFTIHEYDWTSYSMDYQDARREPGDGTKLPAWESTMEKYALPNIELTLIPVGFFDEGNLNAVKMNPEWMKVVFQDDSLNAMAPYDLDDCNEALRKNKEAVENYVMNNRPEGTIIVITDEKGEAKVTLSKEEQGIYLVLETRVPENVDTTTDPFLIGLPMANGSDVNYDVHVYPKNQTSVPTVKKLVKGPNDKEYKDSTSISGGDTVYYNIVSNIPKVTTDATKFHKYEFADNLPAGIECETTIDASGNVVLAHPEDVVISIYDNEEDARQVTGNNAQNLVYGEDYTLQYVKVDDGQSKLIVTLTEKGLEKLNANGTGSKYISVSYPTKVVDADLLISGAEGSRSDVTLTYGRTNSESSASHLVLSEQTLHDAALIMIYGIDLEKKFSDDSKEIEKLSEVQFCIKNFTTGKYLIAEARDEKNGNYKVSGSTDNKDEATRLIPGEDGRIVVDAMAADVYEIEELATADGFVLLKEPVKVEIISSEFDTIPTTAVLAGQSQEVENVGIVAVSGKKDAKAYVNGEETEVTKDGYVSHAHLTVINQKKTIIDTITDVISPITGDYSKTKILIGIAVIFGIILIISAIMSKKNK